jgi:hypothetical protein
VTAAMYPVAAAAAAAPTTAKGYIAGEDLR